MEFDYKSNSHKSKKEVKKEEKKIEKVVTGSVKKKKKNKVTKLTSVFLPEDVTSVKDYILQDALIPAVKKFITDSVDMILYGETGSKKKRSSSFVSYRDFSDKRERKGYNDYKSRTMFDYDDIFLESRRDAENVLKQMHDIINDYEILSVADMFDLVGEPANYTMNKYGWRNIDNAEIVHTREGYKIKMPRALPFD